MASTSAACDVSSSEKAGMLTVSDSSDSHSGRGQTSALVHTCLFDSLGPTYRARDRLPAIMVQRSQFNVWSFLKQNIGKELSKITMPVVFNEPLSFLQRLTEYMEYSHLIGEASDAADPVKRLELVAAFAVSALASNWDRLGKPFNPLLGETYELERIEELGFRIICEQVSHHPPVSAFFADSPVFRFYGSIHPKLKFWGRSVEIQPKGTVTLELLKHGEVYTWSNVSCTVHNIIVGKLWLEQNGTMEIACKQTGLKCVLHFKPTSQWFGKDTNHIEGFISNKTKVKLRALYGVWTDSLASCDVATFEELFSCWCKSRGDIREVPLHRTASEPQTCDSLLTKKSPDHKAALLNNEIAQQNGEADGASVPALIVIPILPSSTVLWKAFPRPPFSADYYQFTQFAMLLNELDMERDGSLAPTDCRLRPDIRFMEKGEPEKAAAEKSRLEEKQRTVRNSLKKNKKEDISPCWFKFQRHPHVNEDAWLFTDEYWKRDWTVCPDVF